jgi:hypothetical protein
MMLTARIADSLEFAALPWLAFSRAHGHGVSHPLASLVLLAVIFAGVYLVFRRRAG